MLLYVRDSKILTAWSVGIGLLWLFAILTLHMLQSYVVPQPTKFLQPRTVECSFVHLPTWWTIWLVILITFGIWSEWRLWAWGWLKIIVQHSHFTIELARVNCLMRMRKTTCYIESSHQLGEGNVRTVNKTVKKEVKWRSDEWLAKTLMYIQSL